MNLPVIQDRPFSGPWFKRRGHYEPVPDEVADRDPTVCVCGCHRRGCGMLHFAPCCGNCPPCGERIRRGEERSHLAVCPGIPRG
jgi:hypothetical protein